MVPKRHLVCPYGNIGPKLSFINNDTQVIRWLFARSGLIKALPDSARSMECEPIHG